MSGLLHPLVRPRDPFGDGAFKARRDGGTRLHMGVDLCAWPRQVITAWTMGLRFMRTAAPYEDDPRFGGVLLQLGSGEEVKIFYVAPREDLRPGALLQTGDVIGHAQDLRIKYVGITPHVHVEVWKAGERIDPTEFISVEMA